MPPGIGYPPPGMPPLPGAAPPMPGMPPMPPAMPPMGAPPGAPPMGMAQLLPRLAGLAQAPPPTAQSRIDAAVKLLEEARKLDPRVADVVSEALGALRGGGDTEGPNNEAMRTPGGLGPRASQGEQV
jgi:hypothetical protein